MTRKQMNSVRRFTQDLRSNLTERVFIRRNLNHDSLIASDRFLRMPLVNSKGEWIKWTEQATKYVKILRDRLDEQMGVEEEVDNSWSSVDEYEYRKEQDVPLYWDGSK